MPSFGPVAQMYEQELQPVKGWFDMSALEKVAPLHATLLASATEVPAGRVAALDSSGNFVLVGYSGTGGVTTPKHQMPIFLWNASQNLDVYVNGTSPISGVSNWTSIAPDGSMSGLVATGGYELQTTEFDTTKTYAPNDLLTVTSSASIATAGKLTNQSVTQYTTYIVGIASTHVNPKVEDAHYATGATAPYGGAKTGALPTGYNANGNLTLTFWTYFLPASA